MRLVRFFSVCVCVCFHSVMKEHFSQLITKAFPLMTILSMVQHFTIAIIRAKREQKDDKWFHHNMTAFQIGSKFATNIYRLNSPKCHLVSKFRMLIQAMPDSSSVAHCGEMIYEIAYERHIKYKSIHFNQNHNAYTYYVHHYNAVFVLHFYHSVEWLNIFCCYIQFSTHSFSFVLLNLFGLFLYPVFGLVFHFTSITPFDLNFIEYRLENINAFQFQQFTCTFVCMRV